MTLQELVNKLREHIPNLQVGEDNDGQIVVYTNKKIVEGETLAEMEEV